MIAQHAMKLRPSTNVLGLFIKFFQKKKRPQNATFFTFFREKTTIPTRLRGPLQFRQ